ncbi:MULTISPECIES: alpha/beta fold hydrolase [unclassified Paenibacillus]|uniref:alpha/beta fold hydrolase n=1 Tax=unclassified Paenibacillus TaxID=185978 RepID=UPI002405062F|nr:MULTISPECIES: alpha/beta fold hydrolase [unclassified Paenibacillus]MDF9844107.1 pimeloyl-ACP methyl ester carboxylesterase [Paenibacillus sp. PastF-2]MDF9850771.1 pimeloyl-ACP methyl ester carboxylesterase [Paenibacillus sp. PastM-2]MDF9857341.1 pimeloyl-ACP methyl ester carboxylesterase [Paenibacillus sp. PastF-1]MDH6482551.1 pimeloyl-ACP methyl ester carboxylesterase [Paenibacillus sp. PastH-2]MDH6509979.1 pimeloyl-ACP methyl ester carboxylesterase [Paenibacillus sp. PastM-3]
MSKVVLSNGIQISYNYEWTEDNRETLVFMNGTFNSMKDWNEIASVLKQNKPYNILTFDMRNQGESTRSKEDFLYSDLVKDVSLFFEYLKLDNFTVITYSSSSTMAIDYISENPGKVKRLILGAPVVNPYGKFKRQLISQASLKMFEFGDLKDVITLSFPLMYSNAFVEQNQHLFGFIEEQFHQTVEKSLLLPYMKAWDGNDMNMSKLKSVLESVNTHYIHGEEDIFNPKMFSIKLQEEIDDLQLHILPGKGHDFLAEDKTTYIQLLESILK